MPVPCTVARPNAPQRVYCVILRRPDSPSFFNWSSWGLTAVSSCMMIEAEMYGMMPSATILMRSRAPPENMLNRSANVPSFWEKNACNWIGSIPGTGIWVPTR